VLAELIALIAPPRCALCAGPCEVCSALCDPCERELVRLRPTATGIPGLAAAWAAAPYRAVARDLVVSLKFGHRLQLAERAATAIADRAPPELLREPIVPVPAAPGRHRWRGFDAAEEIAKALASATGLPLRPCLERAEGRRQVGRPRSERLADPPLVRVAGRPPMRAVLVDDVLTTGATLRACARALTGAGCERAVAVAFARST